LSKTVSRHLVDLRKNFCATLSPIFFASLVLTALRPGVLTNTVRAILIEIPVLEK